MQYRVSFLFLSKVFRTKPIHSRKAPYERLESEILNITLDKRSKLLDFKNDMYSIAIFNRSLFRFK
jgi:hypothetical protein